MIFMIYYRRIGAVFKYYIQRCFNCRLTLAEDAWIEPSSQILGP
jgi:hypothetical protein